MRRLAAVLTLLAASACGGGDPEKPAQAGANGGAAGSASGGTLVFARGADSEHLDPAIINDGESAKVVTNIFDTLVGFEPGTLKLAPALSDRWSASADGLTWTFHLREATFHDGTPVDADAVVFSFERQRDKDHPAHTDACQYWESFFPMVKGVRAVDPRTVEISLTEASAPFESTMTLFSMSIVSPTAWKSEGIDEATKKYRYKFSEKPVGSGPFRFVRWQRDDTIVLERNENWWGGRAKVAKLWFKTIKDNTQRLLAVETGQADVMDGVNPQDVPRVRGNPAMALDEQAGLNVGYFAMNVTKPPFDDARVRQAVAIAIDKKTILKTAYDGMGEIAVNPMPRALPYWKDQPDRTVDRAKAKKMLADAGKADLAFKLNYMTGPRTYMPRPKDVAIQIQADLKEIGVRCDLEPLEWNRHRADVENARHQSCLLGWMADFGDADNFLFTFFDKTNAQIGSALNAAFYTDEEVHQWLVAARIATAPAERGRLYGLVQEKLMTDAPMVPLVTMPELRVRASKVKGYLIYPAGGEYLASVSVE